MLPAINIEANLHRPSTLAEGVSEFSLCTSIRGREPTGWGQPGVTAACSLVREIRRLRDQLAIAAPGDVVVQEDMADASHHLASLLLGIAGSVSLLNDKLHDSLLTQLLTMPLWSLPTVRPHMRCATGCPQRPCALELCPLSGCSMPCVSSWKSPMQTFRG